MLIWSDIRENPVRFRNELTQVLYELTRSIRRIFWSKVTGLGSRKLDVSMKSTSWLKDCYRKECNPVVDAEVARLRGVEY